MCFLLYTLSNQKVIIYKLLNLQHLPKQLSISKGYYIQTFELATPPKTIGSNGCRNSNRYVVEFI